MASLKKLYNKILGICSVLQKQPSGESLLDQLPDDILEIILGKLWTGERFRCRLVCRKWNRILAPSKNKIPKAMEAPWQIMPDFISSKTQQKEFESLFEGKTYRFKLPVVYTPSDRIRCHGFSGGWILISVEGYPHSAALWNPVSGAVRRLPKLPRKFHYIRGVQVFSLGSVECVVAVLWSYKIFMCTPWARKWTLFTSKMFSFIYPVDRMLFNTRDETLYVVRNKGCVSLEEDGCESYLWHLDEVRLRGCCVRVKSVLVRIPGIVRFYPGFVNGHVKFMRLVESSVTHEVLIVVSVLGNIVNGRKKRQETREFMVFSLSREGKMVRLESIGEQAIFLGSAGSYSVRNVKGVKQDCIYFATGDARWRDLNGSSSYIVGEVGVYSMKKKKMQLNYLPYYDPPERSEFGWFSPQF